MDETFTGVCLIMSVSLEVSVHRNMKIEHVHSTLPNLPSTDCIWTTYLLTWPWPDVYVILIYYWPSHIVAMFHHAMFPYIIYQTLLMYRFARLLIAKFVLLNTTVNKLDLDDWFNQHVWFIQHVVTYLFAWINKFANWLRLRLFTYMIRYCCKIYINIA